MFRQLLPLILCLLCQPLQTEELLATQTAAFSPGVETEEAAAQEEAGVRFGLTSRQFTEITENDAKVALKVWSEKLAAARSFKVNSDAYFFADRKEAQTALEAGTIDGVFFGFDDYYALRQEIAFDHFFLCNRRGSRTERILVLARKDGRIKSLADLKGSSVNLYNHIRMSLALPWLNLELDDEKLPPLDRLAKKLTQKVKLTNVVLPVFFGKVDACVVTENGYQVMKELNPQLEKELTIIAESPPQVPSLFALNKSFHPPYLDELLEALDQLDTTPVGQQVLAIFQCEKFGEVPRSTLDESIDLMRRATAASRLKPHRRQKAR